MKASIFITSYPNTKDKIDILEQCISSVKNAGFPVILVSNMKIPGGITSMVKEYLLGGGMNSIFPIALDMLETVYR